ncbi:TetR family transcriptional regulator [Enterobacter cloacae subsp. cloacae]|nr:TetR family transcriptional regulator [Enterobacter cloacae subsp. cloacae]
MKRLIGVCDTWRNQHNAVTDIADAAKVTRGAVYWHFTSKTEIFNAI